MAKHHITGKRGEDLAAEYLSNKGFHILERNWRYKKFEIDIIAIKSNCIHFIEVKTKSSWWMGSPESRIDRKKLLHLQEGAANYLELNPNDLRVQFDVIAIILSLPPQIELWEDVYVW